MSQRTQDTELVSLLKAPGELGDDCSYWTFRRHVSAGHVAIVRLGRRIFVPRAELERIRREGLPALRTPRPESGPQS